MKKRKLLLVLFEIPILIVVIFAVINFVDSYGLRYQNVAKHGEDISVLVAFGKNSAGRRFIIYDNESKQVIGASKCAHGSGGGSTATKPVFSNTPGSMCSSLGEYRLMNVSTLHNCGLSCIRLQGLSASNSNAMSRGITIHEVLILANDLSVGVPIPVSPAISQGCFGISTKSFELLCDQIKKGKTIYLYATENSL